jgi:hypothetical protein
MKSELAAPTDRLIDLKRLVDFPWMQDAAQGSELLPTAASGR